ncbi:MAG: rhomboid family intramembrane serine protease [Actinomycetota bacterium]|nr:rhomboid family intramembrane serine protease [Actinomycetota bacterium]
MITSCYRHPDRETGIHCTRCGRSICADCMVPAPVGHHCPTCVQEAQPDTRRVRNVQWTRGQGQRAGVVVKGLIAVSVVAFFFQESDPTVTYRYANLPFAVNLGDYYRLTTATFLHANLTHLLLNMFGLWIVGTQLEPVLGRARFLALYLVAGIGGSVAYYLLGDPLVPALGASTAVFGLFGAAFVIAKSRRGDTRTILTLIGINLVFGFVVPGIDNWGHLGGLVTGGMVAGIYELSERWPGSTRVALQVGGVAVIVAAFAFLVDAHRPQPQASAGGGVSREERVAVGRAGVGVPLWEDSRLVTPPACRDLCRQSGPET